MFQYFYNFLYNYKTNKKIKNFNNKIFQKKSIKKSGIILCEFSNNCSNQVAFSFLINGLKERNKSRCVAYQNIIKYSFFQKIKIYIQKFLRYGNFGIYKSFLVDDFILIKANKKIENASKKIAEEMIPQINTKKDLVDLRIFDVHIGDLIYDSYLRENEVPTFDVKEKKFRDFLIFSIKYFLYWKDFFENNEVKNLIITHTVYISTIPLRIAAKRNIISFQCNCHNIYKLSGNNLYAYSEFKTYKDDFKNLDEDLKIKGLKIAEEKIKQRFDGKVGVDMPYSKKSAFHKDFSAENVLSKSKKKKILIAAHDFFDAPHVYGANDIFTDFYEWFQFLKILSKKTDYEWYIKSHRDWFAKTDKILRDFAEKNSNFKVIPSDTSHFQIAKEGISCVLTVYGTIGWEYAYLGIPVINATIDNPHILYDFNLHAKNIKEYEDMVLNFDKYKINYDKKNIFEFYLMHNIIRRSDWLLEDMNETIDQIGYQSFSKTTFYKHFINSFDRDKQSRIKQLISDFLTNDKEYYLKNKNFIFDNASRLELPPDVM